MRMRAKVGRLQKNRWNAEQLSVDPRIYRTRADLMKMKMQNRYDPVVFAMIDGVRREE